MYSRWCQVVFQKDCSIYAPSSSGWGFQSFPIFADTWSSPSSGDYFVLSYWLINVYIPGNWRKWAPFLMLTGPLKVKVKVSAAHLCLTLGDPMDCSPPGSSVHEFSQARILEWVAVPFSRGSSLPRDRTRVSHIAGRFFTVGATGESWLDPWLSSFGVCLIKSLPM